jgi:hypothetical protein
MHGDETGVLLRFVCAGVLFFLSWMLLRFLFQLGIRVVTHLRQIRERPGLPVTITLLVCGTLCVLGALLVVWHGGEGGVNLSPAVNMPANMPGADMPSRIDLSMHTTGSLSRPLAVCAALVIGAALPGPRSDGCDAHRRAGIKLRRVIFAL